MHILERKYLTTNDVLLRPTIGQLESRQDAKLFPYIYSAPMDRVTNLNVAKAMVDHGQYAVLSRFLPQRERQEAIEELAGSTDVFFAVGGCYQDLDFVLEHSRGKTINICVDIAHGASPKGFQIIRAAASELNVQSIMSGSVATVEAAQACVQAGANALRVGIGPGSACTTRIMTGIGIPQLSAVYRIAKCFQYLPVEVIADGGIRSPGDANKYLAAGADSIMLGSELAKTREAPGWVTGLNGMGLLKEYRGQASASFQSDYGKRSDCPEGSTRTIKWKGHKIQSVLNRYEGGLRSCLSYLGLSLQAELGPEAVEFIEITTSGYTEGLANE